MNAVVAQTGAPPAEGLASAFTPALENGDRLPRDEFERRYSAMPHLKKAELIEGVVYTPSPVNSRNHGEPHFDLQTVLGIYRVMTRGVHGSDNATVRLSLANDAQPDVVLYIDPNAQGQVKIEEGYIVGAPELAVEITASNVSYDLGPKLQAYCRNGVREYLVWRVLDRAVDWFALSEDKSDRLLAQDGIFRSVVFPGLWLDAAALVRGDLARVHQVLQEGLASREHADFVARLARHG